MSGSAVDEVSAYDPERHDNQVVAMFEDRQGADGARDALLNAGIPAEAIEVADRLGPPAGPLEPPDGGFWHAIRNLFAPEQDARELADAVERGEVMVLVHPAGSAERELAIEVLEGRGPIDIAGRNHAANSPEPAAEPPPRQSVRIVEERLRVGWRDRTAQDGRVRSYVAERPERAHRVELLEDEIGTPTDRPAGS